MSRQNLILLYLYIIIACACFYTTYTRIQHERYNALQDVKTLKKTENKYPLVPFIKTVQPTRLRITNNCKHDINMFTNFNDSFIVKSNFHHDYNIPDKGLASFRLWPHFNDLPIQVFEATFASMECASNSRSGACKTFYNINMHNGFSTTFNIFIDNESCMPMTCNVDTISVNKFLGNLFTIRNGILLCMSPCQATKKCCEKMESPKINTPCNIFDNSCIESNVCNNLAHPYNMRSNRYTKFIEKYCRGASAYEYSLTAKTYICAANSRFEMVYC